MANKVQIKRGNKANLPVLSDGELAYCKDVGQLFVGNGDTSVQVGAAMESGTWTPTMPLTGNFMLDPSVCNYTKIANVVTLNFEVHFSFESSSSVAGTLQINGLPFAASKEAAAVLSSYESGMFNITGLPLAVMEAGTQSICFKATQLATSTHGKTEYVKMTKDNLVGGVGRGTLVGTLTYLTA